MVFQYPANGSPRYGPKFIKLQNDRIQLLFHSQIGRHQLYYPSGHFENSCLPRLCLGRQQFQNVPRGNKPDVSLLVVKQLILHPHQHSDSY